MAVVLTTVREVLWFIEGFDGEGLVVTDDELIVTRLRDYFELADDYEEKGKE